MTRFYNMASAAIASLILVSGASAASAQTFNQPTGTLIYAEGDLAQDVDAPGPNLATNCHVKFSGQVSSSTSLTFTSYTGFATDSGPLDCANSLTFPIIVDITSATQIKAREFIVGTREGPCAVTNFPIGYDAGFAVFDGVGFGVGGICHAEGDLAVTTQTGGAAVLIQ